ncbi:hypothetical protein [Aureispira sp. CCB-E]|uniref:hypothetical protein n=1 Tax=Aureispira sp. CCB-E TaxID=3051121 RepID=UPI002868D2D5|nr:hypothetical protein [Aureispira sp. CCB-E]WMX14273.1 hypothetical protein QP953_25805 [Aureispira sp. CCB-E]
MFSLFRKNKKIQHPLFGELVYRANRATNKTVLPGFWQGRLQLMGDSPTTLIIWGDKNEAPHPKQTTLFNQIVGNIEAYVLESKKGIAAQLQEEQPQTSKAMLALEQLYIQAYPMTDRLKQDLTANLEGVAWGFQFSIDFKGTETPMTGYSAYVDLELHPTFPFTCC